MDDEIQAAGSSEDELRKQAIQNLKKKAAFKQTLLAYVVVNVALVVIWAVTDPGYFWPIWVIGGWGIGLAFQAYDAYGRRGTISEDKVQSEVNRLRSG